MRLTIPVGYINHDKMINHALCIDMSNGKNLSLPCLNGKLINQKIEISITLLTDSVSPMWMSLLRIVL